MDALSDVSAPENPATRLINFTDAIVAIAATLLILQPIDAAAGAGIRPLADVLAENGGELLGFAVSFIVIGQFWYLHRKLFKTVHEVTSGVFWVNLVWLFSIVFLQYPTAMLSRSVDSHTSALYIGTVTLTTLAAFILEVIIPPPSEEAGGTRSARRLAGSTAVLAAMCIALVLSLTVPSAHLWGLLLLIPAMLVGRRRSTPRPSDSHLPSTG